MASPRRLLIPTLLQAADGSAWRVHQRMEREGTSTFGRRFVIIFRDAVEILASIRHPTAQRLSHLLPHMLEPSNWRRLDQRVLAAELGVSQPSISQGLTVLINAGIVEREGRGPGTRYRISPRVAWRGTAGAYHAQQQGEGRNYAAEVNGYSLKVQLDLALPAPPKRKEKKEGPTDPDAS